MKAGEGEWPNPAAYELWQLLQPGDLPGELYQQGLAILLLLPSVRKGKSLVLRRPHAHSRMEFMSFCKGVVGRRSRARSHLAEALSDA
jgi:hypothetical protein